MVLGALCLSACAGDGANEQVVTILSDPPGATCQVSRENINLGTVPQTPGSLRVSKSIAPLIVACSAAGYETITGGFEALFRGNRLFAASGGEPPVMDARSYSYPSVMSITLRR